MSVMGEMHFLMADLPLHLRTAVRASCCGAVDNFRGVEPELGGLSCLRIAVEGEREVYIARAVEVCTYLDKKAAIPTRCFKYPFDQVARSE